jgi:hypothetical protein
MTGQKMPAAYIGRSGPSGAFRLTPVTQAWRDYAASVPRPDLQNP